VREGRGQTGWWLPDRPHVRARGSATAHEAIEARELIGKSLLVPSSQAAVFSAAELAYLESQPVARLAIVASGGVVQNTPVSFHVNRELGTIDIGCYTMAHEKWAHRPRAAALRLRRPCLRPRVSQPRCCCS
jgi:hypothetical protein